MTSSTHNSSSETLSVRALAALAVVGWVGLLLVAREYPATRLWSINHLAFLPRGFSYGVMAAGLIAVLVILIIRSRFAWSSTHRNWWRRWPGACVLIGSVLGAGWLLRAQTPLLGDGILRGADILRPEVPLGSELLASVLAKGLLQLGLFPGSTGGYGALALVSLLFAGILALGLWYYTPRSGMAHSWAFVFWILTFGSFRLLAGYVESYAPAFALLVLWGIAAVGVMRDRLSPWHMIMLCGLAILGHAAALGVAPATAWVLWRRYRQRRTGAAPLIVFPLIAVALAAFIGWEVNRQQVGGIGVDARHFIMPLLPGADIPYSILSLPHIVDFLNEWLLLIPAALVAGVLFILRRPPQPTSISATSTPDPRDERVFWVLAIVPLLVGSLIIDPKLGWARDWDLMTVFLTPALVGAALWLSRLRSTSIRQAAASVALISLGLWLAIGARAGSEERRFEALLELDPSRAAYGHEILAIYNRANDRLLGEIEQFQAALEYEENVRYRANIANAYQKLGRVDDAISWYESICARDSTVDIARYGLALAYMRKREYERALPHAEAACANQPDDAKRAFVLGSILLYLKRPEEALSHLEAAAKGEPSNADYLNILGGCYLRLDRELEARAAWRQAIVVNPDDVSPYVNLASVELNLGNIAEARRLLDRYATLVPKSKWTAAPRQLYDTLQRIDQ